MITGLTALIVSLLLYFLPAVVAFWRGHHNRWAILLLNLLLDWTFWGWIIGLIWSVTAVYPFMKKINFK